jgi:hypothetical protein
MHVPCLYAYYIYMIHMFYVLMFHIVMDIFDIMISIVGTLKLGYPLLLYKDAVSTRLSLVAW